MTRLQRAVAHVGAVKVGVALWAHYADETSRWYQVSSDELRELCDYLDNPDPQINRDAYSHWCAGTSARAMPADWTPGSEVGK